MLENGQMYLVDLSNKPDWFQKISPMGKVPILTTGEEKLFESQVIAEYLDEITYGSLHPSDPMTKAKHRSWIEFGNATLNAIGGFYSATDRTLFEEKRLVLCSLFEHIEEKVVGPYFAGDTFHMIDGVWGPIFRYFEVFDTIDDFEIMVKLDRVNDWIAVLSERSSIIGAVPAGYPERLELFLLNKKSYLSTLMANRRLVRTI